MMLNGSRKGGWRDSITKQSPQRLGSFAAALVLVVVLATRAWHTSAAAAAKK